MVTIIYAVRIVCEQEFFLTVKDVIRRQPTGVGSYLKFSSREQDLLSRCVAVVVLSLI